MSPRKQSRTQDGIYSAQTGDGFSDQENEPFSDVALRRAGSTEPQQIGRTPYDLLHEGGFSRPLSRFFDEFEPVEFMFVVAYVLLSGWGNCQHPIWPFFYFGLSLVLYHVVGRPIAGGLTHWAKAWGKRSGGRSADS